VIILNTEYLTTCNSLRRIMLNDRGMERLIDLVYYNLFTRVTREFISYTCNVKTRSAKVLRLLDIKILCCQMKCRHEMSKRGRESLFGILGSQWTQFVAKINFLKPSRLKRTKSVLSNSFLGVFGERRLIQWVFYGQGNKYRILNVGCVASPARNTIRRTQIK
jgi:hypothetical protein